MMTSIYKRTEQGGKHMLKRMMNGKDKQEGQKPDMDAEPKEPQQAPQGFIRSMVRSGVNIALFPVNRLPPEPQQHFQAAGREFTLGVATLIHKLAEGLEGMAKDDTTSTNSGEGPHTNREFE
jgi:hypothetical protein